MIFDVIKQSLNISRDLRAENHGLGLLNVQEDVSASEKKKDKGK